MLRGKTHNERTRLAPCPHRDLHRPALAGRRRLCLRTPAAGPGRLLVRRHHRLRLREVGSTDDIYAPLIDLETGRRYDPVAWDVSFGDFHFVDSQEGVTRRTSVECSYVDEWVSGTVTVKRARCHDRGGHHGHRGARHQDRWDRNRHGRHSRRG
jgi:hypothetical protein